MGAPAIAKKQDILKGMGELHITQIMSYGNHNRWYAHFFTPKMGFGRPGHTREEAIERVYDVIKHSLWQIAVDV